MPGTLRSLAFEAVPQLGAKCASKRSFCSASANLHTVEKSCGLVRSYDATGKFSALFGFLSTAKTLKPRFLHALLNLQDPAKISKIKPEPLLDSFTGPLVSAEASVAKTVELQKELHALSVNSVEKDELAPSAASSDR